MYLSMDLIFTNTTKPENILIVNIGSLGTKLSLIQFHPLNFTNSGNKTSIIPGVKTLNDLYSRIFSGNVLDHCLSEYALAK